MKLATSVLGVIATLALFSGQFALATPASSSSTAPQSGAVTRQELSECEQDCLDEYRKNLRKNKKATWTCTFSVLGVCLVGHYQEDVLDDLNQAAADIHEACLEECEEPQPES